MSKKRQATRPLIATRVQDILDIVRNFVKRKKGKITITRQADGTWKITAQNA